MAYVQTQTRVPNQIPETRIWDILNLYLDKIHADVKARLTERLNRDVDVLVTVENEDDSGFDVKVEVTVELKEVQRVYYDGISESCASAISEKVAEGEIPEERAEDAFAECIEEEIKRYDEEYGGKPFEFRYKYASFEAYLDTIIDDRTHYRRYVDVLVFVHRFRVLRSLLEHIIRDSHYSVINTGAEYEANTISAEIEKIVKAVEALYGDD